MEYGHNAGCKFLTGKCMASGATEWPKMFCDVPESAGNIEVCTTDRLGLGECILKDNHDSPLHEYFRYFISDKKGDEAEGLTDHCPVVEQLPSIGCKKATQAGRAPGSLFAENSMCLDGNALKVKGTPDVPVAAVCAVISCVGGSVKVKYDGDKTNKWHDCPEGQSLTPSSTSDSFGSGTIKCPNYKEVCTVAPDGSSLVPKVIIEPPTTAPQDPKASQKPTGQPNDPNSGGKSKDSSSVPFGFIPSVAFLVLSFAGCLIA